ncbi:GGDEF domain-containing protein [Pseudaquabacterium pictum]|uniref:diguanylate cyclase n=1 Tax=Pseudaquabacterium pictum TaxID=2315236 RepID=A0A480AK77_9BURK|nr:GGDEF domain-containing protein [Rubrivivax pictus]GCL61426.1 GGDEF domain-containing protein [Rubrivivax pictus]
MSNWDPSTIAIDPSQLTLLQGLDSEEARRCSLVVYSGGDTGRQITLPEGTSSIGRSAAASLQIDGPGMSRLHAEVVVDGTQVLLRDLGSANGSYVQDVRLTGPRPLRDGDRVRLGSVLLKFYEHQSVDAALHDRVYRMAMVDAGTGLYNRRYLHETLRRELRQTRQGGRPMAVISFDLDRFKSVNDTHGHAAGDLVLRECAVVVSGVVGAGGPGSPTLGRLGGEEFLVLMPGATLPVARALAERLRAAVAGHTFVLPAGLADSRPLVAHRQTISLGVAEWTSAMLDASDLLDAADRRLYQAKHEGRDRVCS